MKRHTSRRYLRTLRREYVRDRGRHDRCWDGVTVGKWALRNAMRTGLNVGAFQRIRGLMLVHFYTGRQVTVAYEPPPRVRAKLRRRGEKT